jgi:hypothetical protein
VSEHHGSKQEQEGNEKLLVDKAERIKLLTLSRLFQVYSACFSSSPISLDNFLHGCIRRALGQIAFHQIEDPAEFHNFKTRKSLAVSVCRTKIAQMTNVKGGGRPWGYIFHSAKCYKMMQLSNLKSARSASVHG